MPSENTKYAQTFRQLFNGEGAFENSTLKDVMDRFAKTDPLLAEQFAYENQILEDIGRVKSGAAMRVDEWMKLRNAHFAVPYDKPEAKANKAAYLARSIDAFRIAAGPALSSVKAPTRPYSYSSPRDAKIGETFLYNGSLYTKISENKFEKAK
ncbi:MAG TPA: hypothetical protein DCE71_05440 [Parachlamydiales bacterium]|nr:hypothetical protein [Parachlamydiales bacterium]